MKSWDGDKLNVTDFMDKWIKQMGYPVVEMYRIDDHTIELTQRRFKLDHLTPEKAKYRNAQYWYKWDVPIFYELNGNPPFQDVSKGFVRKPQWRPDSP
ncbi:hypothetical protein COOONC_11593 [Cooperia oncophora]